MTPARRNLRRLTVGTGLAVAVALGATACGGPGSSAPSTSPSTPSSTVPAPSTSPSTVAGPSTTTTQAPGSAPLTPPLTSVTQDGQYFTEVGEADPTLDTYEQQQGNVALRALLTDGTAFCALLSRGGGIDQALVSEAVGVRSQESQTKLPLSVTTYNTIESVALLTLCPSEQSLVPAADRTRIRALGASLAGRSG